MLAPNVQERQEEGNSSYLHLLQRLDPCGLLGGQWRDLGRVHALELVTVAMWLPTVVRTSVHSRLRPPSHHRRYSRHEAHTCQHLAWMPWNLPLQQKRASSECSLARCARGVLLLVGCWGKRADPKLGECVSVFSPVSLLACREWVDTGRGAANQRAGSMSFNESRRNDRTDLTTTCIRTAEGESFESFEPA